LTTTLSKDIFREVSEGVPTREIRDPRAMRALAHPTRLHLLELLAREGPLTATRAGELLGESAANASFHLRQLAKYGFVEEAGGGQGRERPWRAVSISHHWTGVTGEGETSVAATSLTAMVLDRELHRLMTWLETRSRYPVAWQEAAIATSSLLYLTLDELEGVGNDLETLIGRFFGRLTDPESRPPESRPVSLLALGYPIEPTPSGG
jgi:DNA-binding transcriptional ArsR family regulator